MSRRKNTLWLVGAVSLVVLLGLVLFYKRRQQPDCAFSGWKNLVGVEIDTSISDLRGLRGKLNLSEQQVREFDELLRDYALKYDTACNDMRNGRMSQAEYACRRQNMDRALDAIRSFTQAVEAAKAISEPTAQSGIILAALAQLERARATGYGAGCVSSMSVDPVTLRFDDHFPERSISIGNGGNNDLTFSIDNLPEGFVPLPQTGNLTRGSSTRVTICRLNMPLSVSPIVFRVRSNFQDQKEVTILLSTENAQLYRDWSEQVRAAGQPAAAAALSIVDAALAPDVQNREAVRHVLAAGVLSELGEQAVAHELLAAAIAQTPSLSQAPQVLLFRGVIEQRQGASDRARASFHRAEELAPSDGRTRATAKLFAGSLETRAGNRSAATRLLGAPDVATWTKNNPTLTRFAEREFNVSNLDSKIKEASRPNN